MLVGSISEPKLALVRTAKTLSKLSGHSGSNFNSSTNFTIRTQEAAAGARNVLLTLSQPAFLSLLRANQMK